MCFDEKKSRAISRAGSRFTVRTSSDSSSESDSLKSSESEFLDFRFFFPFFPAFSFFLSESSSSSESSPESSEFLAFRFRPLVALSFFGLSISSISESESATIRFNISAFYFGMFFSKSWGFLRRPHKEISLNFAAFSEYLDFMTI